MRTHVKTTARSSAVGHRRGRPPSAAAREAILRAAREMLAEVGPSGVTVEGIATRAGVGKPTIYRWWSDRHAVVMAALMADVEVDAPPRAARSPLMQLRHQLHAIAERFATPTGRHVTAMLAAADPNSELSKAFRNHFVMARRAEGAAFLRAAIQSGELDRLDIDVALDLLFGAVFFRLLMSHAPLDATFVDNMFELALRSARRGATSRQRNAKARRR